MKYNIEDIINNNDHKTLLKVSDYSKEEQKELIKYFSEGSTTMELALRVLWNKKLYTTACCKGHLFGERNWIITYKEAYFAFDRDVNVLKYLSNELLSNPYVMFSDTCDSESIYFFGKDKEKLILKFTQDIMMQREINSEYLKTKMNKPITREIYEEVKRDYYLESGFTEEEIKELNRIDIEYLILDEQSNYTYVSEEEYDNLWNKKQSIYDCLKTRKLSKKRGR